MKEAEYEVARRVGVGHGLVHALATMKQVRGNVTYPYHLPPRHHSRKRAAKLAEVKALDTAIELVTQQIRGVRCAGKPAASEPKD